MPSMDIPHIVQEEAEKVQNQEIRALAYELLEEWEHGNTPDRFCDEVILPRLRTLKGQTRRSARTLLQRIKNRIADEAAKTAFIERTHRQSAQKMSTEILNTYRLIEELGRGPVYFGSARTQEGDTYYELGRELGYEIQMLLDSTSWTGAGPGQMEAPLKGAKAAGGKIGGIKIHLSPESAPFEQKISPILSIENTVECNYFGPRKVGLIDAGVRDNIDSKTAYVFLPGGYGTLDELFEMLDLVQLKKLGSKEKPIFILMNYKKLNKEGYYYDKLLEFLREIAAEGAVSEAKNIGAISAKDLNLFSVCHTNKEALDLLADHYAIPDEKRTYKERLL